jgi:DnaJ-class molecular chaperone
VRKDKTFIPENHGMIFCPGCKGLGKFYANEREFQVCSVCGGFGAIKKPENKIIHSDRVLQSPKKGILAG